MKIGVFDSGVGGLYIAGEIQKALPEHEVYVAEDSENLPYGDKKPAELLALVEPILEGLVELGCDVIVIACNTVSTTIIDQLRKAIKVPLVGIEPMIKPAAELTNNNKIAVCATPTTLASPRYAELKRTYARGVEVYEPDCSQWAMMIEDNSVNEQIIKEQVGAMRARSCDVIVLGCTHYHWIEEVINELSGPTATVIQPTTAILNRLKKVLAQLAETAGPDLYSS